MSLPRRGLAGTGSRRRRAPPAAPPAAAPDRAPPPLPAPGTPVRPLLAAAIATLRAAGVDTPELDASLLLGHALATPRERLLLDPDRVPPPAARAAFDALLARRARREPVAYLLGSREFFGLPLAVDPRVLIPRPDTECLVEAALARLPGDGAGTTVLDVGTGSGAIAAALRDARPRCRVLALDASPEALAVARANFAALGLAVEVLLGDLLAPVAPGSLDLLVSNPPYLDPAVALAPELGYEPGRALFAGDRGLALVARLLEGAPRVLKPGGWVLVEHGAEQGPAARAAALGAGLREVRTGRDLGGRDRFVEARR